LPPLWLLIAAVALADSPQAAERVSAPSPSADVRPAEPDELELAVEIWPLVGTARLKVLLWEVYDSQLFTPSGSWQGEAPYQLSLRYLRDIPASKLVEETDKAWRQQGRSHPKQSEWLQQLNDIWPDIARGDNLVFGLNVKGQSAFWFNGRPIGGIDDGDFGALFGGIWLDQDSPQPELRDQLIGLH
jgi:hypothetical protein